MDNIKVLVIDDNLLVVSMIKKYFNNHKRISIVLEANNGEDGIRLIKEKQSDYDVVVLDLVMPNKDGLDVLEEMEKLDINKKVIVLTSLNSDEVIRETSNYEIDYYMLKPIKMSDLEKRIINCFNTRKVDKFHNKLHIAVSKILHELGVPSHIKGFQYIREGIILLYDKEESTKNLYFDIAKIYTTNASSVERAIRHAIEVGWNRGNWDMMEDIFGNSIDLEKAKPTNREFITTIVDKLRLERRIN